MRMKEFYTLKKVLLFATLIFNVHLFAQAPVISYGVSGTQNLVENTAIGGFTPSASGGAINIYYKAPVNVVSGLSSPTDVIIDYYSNVIVGNSASPGGITIYNGSTSSTLGTSLVNSLGVNKLKASPFFGYIYFTTVGSPNISYYDNATPRNLNSTNAYGLTSPSGIAVDYYSTNLFVIDNGSVYQLSLSSPGTKTLVTGIAGTPIRITNAGGVVYLFDSLGNLYYILSGTSTPNKIGNNGSIGSPWFTFDAANNAYLTLAGVGATLEKLTSSGSTSTINVEFGNSYGGVGIDNANHIYVANRTTNKLEEYSLTSAYTVSPALPLGLSLDPATGIISGTPTVATAPSTYTITAGNQNTFSPTQFYSTGSTTISLSTQPNTWIGTTSSFSNVSNWWGGFIPTNGSLVSIPSSVPNQPAIDADLTVAGITFTGSGSTLDLNGHTLTINGAVTGSGSLKGSTTSSLVIGGSAGTINFDPANNNLQNLTINSGSLTLGNALNLYGKLFPTSGTLNTGGILTLKSVSIGTAVVESVSGTINGTVKLERYIPQGYMAFRDLSVSVSGAGSIASTWGQSLSNYKTFTYTNGVWDTLAQTVSPTKYTGYRELITGYQNQTTPPITRSNMNSAVTLSYSGTLLTGNQNIPLTSGIDKFTFVGNPYASQVNFDALTQSGIYGGYWYLDPINITANNFENYNYYGTNIGSSNIYASNAGKYIQPGQAFFVCSNSATPSLIFNENAKDNSGAQVGIFGAATPLNRIALGLFSNGQNLDGAVSVFNSNFTNGISKEDGLKINNPGENITFAIGGKELCANGWNIPVETDLLPIHLFQLSQNKTYTLRIDVTQFSVNNIQAFLNDNLLNTQTPLLGDSNVVTFTTTSDTSAYSNRYSISFQKNTLPIKSVNITATTSQNNSIAIKWSVIGAVDILNYQVEHSIDGVNFKSIKTVNSSTNSFSFIDENPIEGINYYRIKSTDISGNISYSSVTSIQFTVNNSVLKVFPNPIVGNTINLRFGKNNLGNFVIRILDNLGQTVLNTSINHTTEGSIESILIGKHLSAGRYRITATNASGTNILKTQAIIQ